MWSAVRLQGQKTVGHTVQWRCSALKDNTVAGIKQHGTVSIVVANGHNAKELAMGEGSD